MIYNTFKGVKISDLGFGSMNLPIINGDSSRIDEKKAAEMIDYAIGEGVNYFDTGWGYNNGNGAAFLGSALSAYPRESYLLAHKFPGYNPLNMKRAEDIFEKQLEDCKVDYFDFYLMHDVDDEVVDMYTHPDNPAVRYFIEQKKKGRIKHLGFSTYGSTKTIGKFIDTYGDDIEFCQIPLNYLAWASNNVKDKVELLKKRNIPIWVMDPMYKGKLARLSDERESVLNEMRPNDSVGGWALRFAMSVTSVKTIVYDMATLDQVKKSVEVFNDDKLLNGKESMILMSIAKDIIDGNTI